MKSLALGLLLLPLGTAAQDPRPVPRPGLTWEAADALARRFAEMEARTKRHETPADGTVMVRDGELNSWVNLTLGPQIPQGVSDVALRFEKDRVSATGNVDLSRIPMKGVSGASALSTLAYLGGVVPVTLTAKLTSQDGFGTVVPEEVRVASIPLASSVVAQIVAQATRNKDNPQGFDILSPFRLPYSAKRIRLAPGKAFLEF